MDFNQREDLNGIRFSWNVWPTNRIDAVMCSVPIGCLYTPLKQIQGHQPLSYEPVACRQCRCILNPYCAPHISYDTHVWTCPMCQARNPLPTSYHQMREDCLPVELLPDYTTVEYTINTTAVHPPIFVFVVDTCSTEKEHQALKDLLLQTMATLPQNSLVGFISFGSLIYLHELQSSNFPRSYVFSGNKTYSVPELIQMLSIQPQNVEDATNPFILTIDDAELMLNNVIDKFEPDSYQPPNGERKLRCTGAAVHLATMLIQSLYPQTGGQILVLTSGPITKGPGTMAPLQKSEPVRQHADIEKGKAALTTSAITFFNDLGSLASEHNIVINYIAAAFEETGLHEIEACILKTGGWLMSCESWAEINISQTLKKYFTEIFPVMGSDCSISLNCTKNFKISGCIGACTSMNRMSDVVSEKSVGNGGTTEWKISGILPSTTLAFFVEIAASKAEPIASGSTAFIQFVTKYRHIQSGTYRLRVTTAAVLFNDLTSNKHNIASSFDQEAATVLLARYAMWKVRDEDLLDVIHYIDRTLIRFCRKFGTYNKGDPQSFSLASSFVVFPQFMYHFRRSPFMNTFNSSPDYTASLRHSLLLEDVTSSLFMIQPTLMQYTLDAQPHAVILDTANLQRNCVLLLDTFFRVLIWHGSDIAQWRDAGYQNQPEYANLKALLEDPVKEAQELISERFPTPLLVSCDQDSSKSRYLLARCNPSSQGLDGLGAVGGENLGTDEPSFAKFSAKLKQVAVND